jgi:hypothetical protein
MMISKGIEDIDIRMPKDAYDTGKDMPTFNAYLIAIVRDSEGKVVKVHRQRSRSPTANFIGLMLPLTYFVVTNSSYTITSTGNSTYNYKSAPFLTGISITYPNTAYNYLTYILMIQVGSGQWSNPYSAYALAAPIANGSGAGQLVYGQPSIPSNITVSGSKAYFTISQTFNNNSGATIAITEVGIITQISLGAVRTNAPAFSGSLLVWYDVFSSTISVPNGGSVAIYFTFAVNP